MLCQMSYQVARNREPTGNLDNDMSNMVVNEMLSMVKQNNIALLMVSHCLDYKSQFDNVYGLNGDLTREV